MGRMYGKSGTKSRKTGRLTSINPSDYPQIVFFTGAGMSAESGIPTYRGGGIWEEYNWEEFACGEAFQNCFRHIRALMRSMMAWQWQAECRCGVIRILQVAISREKDEG